MLEMKIGPVQFSNVENCMILLYHYHIYISPLGGRPSVAPARH